jgi:hypothetical protein
MHKISQVRDVHLVQHQTCNIYASRPCPVFRSVCIRFDLLSNVDISTIVMMEIIILQNSPPEMNIHVCRTLWNKTLTLTVYKCSVHTPHTKHSFSITTTDRWVFRETVMVYYWQSHKTHCGQYEENFNLETGGTHSYQCDCNRNRKYMRELWKFFSLHDHLGYYYTTHVCR